MNTNFEILKQYCIDVDMTEANNKGLVTKNELNDNYFKCLFIYKKILNKYLCEKLNLKEYDNLIKNHPLKFIPNSTNNYDIYQYTSNVGMEYIYIRNNLFIERLDKSQIDTLVADYDNSNISKNSLVIVQNTYQDIIKMYKDKPDFINLSYGPFSPDYFAKNKSIVIGVNVNLFNFNGLTAIECRNKFSSQMLEIGEIIEKMNVELKDKLDIPIKVIRYDENSIMPIKKNEMGKSK